MEQRKGTANRCWSKSISYDAYKVTTEPNARLTDTSHVTKLTLGEDSADMYHKQDRSASTPVLSQLEKRYESLTAFQMNWSLGMEVIIPSRAMMRSYTANQPRHPVRNGYSYTGTTCDGSGNHRADGERIWQRGQRRICSAAILQLQTD